MTVLALVIAAFVAYIVRILIWIIIAGVAFLLALLIANWCLTQEA